MILNKCTFDLLPVSIAMNRKTPSSIITNGDIAMKNVIRKVFPNVYHMLCSRHLLKNALTNIHFPEFLNHLKKCMLRDFEVVDFENHWANMISNFGLEHNNCIAKLYQRRKMWSALIRGNLFVGSRTTYHCEAFHSHVKKYLHSRINLTNFVLQFSKCLLSNIFQTYKIWGWLFFSWLWWLWFTNKFYNP